MATSGKADGMHVALLRGINLGTRRLPMQDLAEMFARAGCGDVRTYIQSGNVVFRAEAGLVKKLPGMIIAAIQKKFGFEAPVLIRNTAEMATVAGGNPFLRHKVDPKCLHVTFLDRTPSAAAVAALDPNRSPGDEFVVKGREIYLYLPDGAASSKLNNQFFDSKLKTVSSVRNWNTVLTLYEMMQN